LINENIIQKNIFKNPKLNLKVIFINILFKWPFVLLQNEIRLYFYSCKLFYEKFSKYFLKLSLQKHRNIILFLSYLTFLLAYGNIGFLQTIFFFVILGLFFTNKFFVKNPKINNFFTIILFIALILSMLTFFGTTFSPEKNTWLLSMVIITILGYKTKNIINFKEILGQNKVEKEKYSFLATLAQRYKTYFYKSKNITINKPKREIFSKYKLK
jgi:ABC-type multidrug transport system permease subunit